MLWAMPTVKGLKKAAANAAQIAPQKADDSAPGNYYRLLRDVVERYRITQVAALRWLTRHGQRRCKASLRRSKKITWYSNAVLTKES
mgnify:CR=1 FL=1